MTATAYKPSKTELSSSIRELTDTIEARKEKKVQRRTERQQQKKAKAKKDKIERLVAPIILLLTVVLSLLAMWIGK